MTDSKVRLSKIMAERGICSRREADIWISKGWVRVNGATVTVLGTKIDPSAAIEITRSAQQERSQLLSVMLNKPIGYVSGQPEKDYVPAIRLLTWENHFGSNQSHSPSQEPAMCEHLAVVGRLDIDSQGLLLFTQDGRLAKQIIGEHTHIEKEYLVRFRGDISKTKLKTLAEGTLVFDHRQIKPARVEQINEQQLRIVLTEGMKRQVRRMCEAVDLQVIGLKRVRIGQLRLADLPEGQWRHLTEAEVNKFLP